MIVLQTLRPLLTLTAATLSSLTFTSVIDCQPSLFFWDRWHGISHTHQNKGGRVTGFYRNKNVWIIGASSGIGEELAYQLARAGCTNLILSARNEAQLQKVANTCRQESASQCQCYCQTLDVLNTQGGEELSLRFENVLQNELPSIPIDIVIFNAGAGQLQPSLETPPQVIQRIMDVNALWPMILTPLLFKHSVFRSLRNKDDKVNDNGQSKNIPHIMVTNSIAAQLPVPLSSVYAASKAAQAHYFASLAAEQPERSLRVDMICPGPVETDFHENHLKLINADGQSNNTKRTNDVATTRHAQNDTKTGNRKSGRGTRMSAGRCVRLMLSAMARKTKDSYQEIWVTPHPMISVLYLQRLFPGLFQKLTTKFGQKRVALWRAGKDLYDPKSWK